MFALQTSPQWLRKIWLLAGVAIIVAIWVVSLMPMPPRVPGGDKWHHFLAYALTAFWWLAPLQVRTTRWLLAFGLIAMGVLIEYAQALTGWRTFEVADMLANGAGVICGSVVAALIPFHLVNARQDK